MTGEMGQLGSSPPRVGAPSDWLGQRLHLGCGNRRLPAPWINTDARGGLAADILLDVYKDLPTIPDGALTWVYASHVIEHLYPSALPGVLWQLHRALAPGGVLTLATTDLWGIIEHRLKAHDAGENWSEALFGEVEATAHPMQAHRDVFWYDRLASMLQVAGFTARPWDIGQYSDIDALWDFARTCRSISVLIEGVKP